MKHNTVYTYRTFSYHLTEFFHVLYNVLLYDKQENELMGSCWNIDQQFLVRNIYDCTFGKIQQ